MQNEINLKISRSGIVFTCGFYCHHTAVTEELQWYGENTDHRRNSGRTLSELVKHYNLYVSKNLFLNNVSGSYFFFSLKNSFAFG